MVRERRRRARDEQPGDWQRFFRFLLLVGVVWGVSIVSVVSVVAIPASVVPPGSIRPVRCVCWCVGALRMGYRALRPALCPVA